MYREPALAKEVHSQQAAYLDPIHTGARTSGTQAITHTI